MNLHTPFTAKLLALISIAALLLLLLLLWMARPLPMLGGRRIPYPCPHAATWQFACRSCSEPNPAFTVYLPLVIRSTASAGTPTPTSTPFQP